MSQNNPLKSQKIPITFSFHIAQREEIFPDPACPQFHNEKFRGTREHRRERQQTNDE
jgi:hypothetical protein